MDIKWIDGYGVEVKIIDGAAVVSANREGLLSLANQLTALADEPSGSHIHYDKYNSLEDGSAELVVEKQPEHEEIKD